MPTRDIRLTNCLGQRSLSLLQQRQHWDVLKLRRLRQAIRAAEADLARGDFDEIDMDNLLGHLAGLGGTGTARSGSWRSSRY